MKKYGPLFVLLSALFFATGGLLIKLNTMSSVSISGGRSFFAFFVMLAYMLLRHHHFRFNAVVLFGALANAGMSLTFTIATKMTTAANAIVLQFMMPVFIIFLLWIFWKQKPDRLAICTVALSIVGMLFFFLESLSAGSMAGNLIAIFSGFLYAIVFLIKKIPNSDFESSILISHGLNFLIGIPSLISEPNINTANIIGIILLGAFQMGLAFIFLNLGLDNVQPVAASLISMIEPILNPILVAVFYGETMGVFAIIGAIIVLGSATFYNLRSSSA